MQFVVGTSSHKSLRRGPLFPHSIFYIRFVVGTCSHNSRQGSHAPVFTGSSLWEHAATTEGEWERDGESRHVPPSPHAGPHAALRRRCEAESWCQTPSCAPARKPDLKPDIWQRSGFLATPATLWPLPCSLPFSRGKGKCPMGALPLGCSPPPLVQNLPKTCGGPVLLLGPCWGPNRTPHWFGHANHYLQ